MMVVMLSLVTRHLSHKEKERVTSLLICYWLSMRETIGEDA